MPLFQIALVNRSTRLQKNNIQVVNIHNKMAENGDLKDVFLKKVF